MLPRTGSAKSRTRPIVGDSFHISWLAGNEVASVEYPASLTLHSPLKSFANISEAFRGALILMEEGAFSRSGANGPYIESTRQSGFVNFGASHYMRILGAAEQAQRAAWYQKWQVHRVVRPEALAGTVHNTLNGQLDVPIHPSLLENTELLGRVAAANAEQNADGSETYLLSQVMRRKIICQQLAVIERTSSIVTISCYCTRLLPSCFKRVLHLDLALGMCTIHDFIGGGLVSFRW